jgi:glutathione synthase/RimK-type ligase-like ATP-grasp enzyme
MPEPDVDEQILANALTAAGISSKLAAWDDPTVDWNSFELAIVRSTWNYLDDPFGFLNWMESSARKTKLWNPVELMRANLHKRYLLDLANQGIEIVPTTIVEKGETCGLQDWGDQKVVIKPAISAGSWLTKKLVASSDEAKCFLQENSKREDMLIQPFMDSVERGGESSWVWIDGEVTHGVIKQPRFHEGFEAVTLAPPPNEAQLTAVQKIMSLLPTTPFYARIDLMESGDRYLLSELELIEPSLFFLQNQAALDQFIDGVKRRLA